MATCPLCAATDTQLHAKAHDIEYCTGDQSYDWLRCDRCRILFIDPMPVDRLAQIYPANYYSFSPESASFVQKAKEWLDRRQFARLLGSLPGNDLSVLDVGGGRGWLLDIARAADPRVRRTCVVDIDADAGTLAEAAGHEYVHGRIEEAAVEGKFDLVLMLNLIEHVTDPRAILAKAHALLKPGGRVFIKTPNFDALDARLFRNRSWAGYHTPRHFVLFCRESLEKTARDAGLAPVSFTYTQGAPFWSVSLLDELRRLGLAKITPDRPAVYHPMMPLLQAASAAFDFARMPFAKLSQMEMLLESANRS